MISPNLRIKRWIKEVIIGLNLCPFAQIPYNLGLIHIKVCNKKKFLPTYLKQLSELNELSKKKRSTTLLVLPQASIDFKLFLNDVAVCQKILEDLKISEIFQLVAFHPRFKMKNQNKNSPAHWINRAPYPTIHIIRSEEIAQLELPLKKAKKISKNNALTLSLLTLEMRRKLLL